MRLKDKVAIVTGGSKGIGQAIAATFAREGARVAICSRASSQAEGQAVVSTIREAGGEAIYIQADIAVMADAQRLVEETVNEWGRLDILCNNAGVGMLRTVEETTAEEWRTLLAINLDGAFHCSKFAIPAMRRLGEGSIVNIASVASFVGFKADAAYCTSKGGLLMLTRQMALDYAPENIRVNAVCPGFIRTYQLEQYLGQKPDPAAAWAEVVAHHPMVSIGSTEEVAAAAVFFASDESSFITGAHLAVDGGLLVRP
jgi:NAD(P)-dependent dehydrogenase (short-subunit alcohol dehydrogenase family)